MRAGYWLLIFVTRVSYSHFLFFSMVLLICLTKIWSFCFTVVVSSFHFKDLVLCFFLSNRQKRALTSWFLIALLHYGGVPEEYFMKLLLNASDGIHSICHVINDALKGLLFYMHASNF